MPRLLGLSILFALEHASACLPVSGDRILAQNLAAEVPAFAALPASTVLGYAPMPGAVRTFERAELESIARSHRITLGDSQKVCFFIPQLPRLPQEETVAAMRRGLPANASLELLELPKFPVPAGEVIFPVDGIEPPQPSDPSVQNWKGYVRYAGTRRLPVWARVRVTVEHTVLVAKRTLKPGETISVDAIAVESLQGPLRRQLTASTLSDAVGRTVLRSVKAGEPIPLTVLEQSPVIHRGDPVKVEVVNGSATLLFDAVSETSAREGEQVQLRNPFSGKVFRARATGAGKAVLSVGNPLSGKSE